MITKTKGHMQVMKEHAEYLVAVYGDWRKAYGLKKMRLQTLNEYLASLEGDSDEKAEVEDDILTCKLLMVHIKRYGLMIEGS